MDNATEDEDDRTDLQREAYTIASTWIKEGRTVTYGLLAKAMGIEPTSARAHLHALERKGWLKAKTTVIRDGWKLTKKGRET